MCARTSSSKLHLRATPILPLHCASEVGRQQLCSGVGPLPRTRRPTPSTFKMDGQLKRLASTTEVDSSEAAGGLPLLLGGIGLSLVLAALIYFLGSGRAQSRVLVDERTDELRFLAMHDPLTGLPNRALIMDRIDQLLSKPPQRHRWRSSLHRY
jgi:hypothetical protein